MVKLTEKKKKIIIASVFCLLLLLRFWLFMTMNWRIEMDSYYDSRLEIGSAIDIASGKWMGSSYSKFILCKGVAFPIFVAISILTRIPYPAMLFLLTIFSSFIFAKAVKPVIGKKWVRQIIFFFILFNPVGLGGEMAYPYRNALAPWLTIIILAGILAIYLRRRAELKKLLPWAGLTLLTTGFFWNLREDSMWILPFLILGASITIIHYLIDDKKAKKKQKYSIRQKIIFSCIAVCPLISVLAWNTGISLINYTRYGIYTTEDRTKTYEAKVLGKLIQIDDGANLEEDVWVSAEALELAKAASPTLATIDLTPFSQWPIIGDYSIWALRDSMANSGYYVDAKTTNKTYQKIYEELSEALKNGTLKRKSGIQLSDTSGLYSFNELIKPLGISFHSIINHITNSEYRVEPERVDHVKSEGDIILYENALGVNLQRSDEQLSLINADQKTIQSNKIIRYLSKINRHISNVIITFYNILSWMLFAGALTGIIYSIYLIIRKRQTRKFTVELLFFAVGLLLLAILNAYLVGLWGTGFELTADSELFKAYTTPQTVIISCFEIIGVCLLAKNTPWKRLAKLYKK